MKHYISEERAAYEDMYHGLFSRKLAEWAVNRMEPRNVRSVDEMKEVMKKYNVQIQDEFIYTAWYLYNMTFADYPKSLKTDEQRAMYVDETICDPDGMPENVLSCFEAKMCNAGVPIYWERMM